MTINLDFDVTRTQKKIVFLYFVSIQRNFSLKKKFFSSSYKEIKKTFHQIRKINNRASLYEIRIKM